MALSVASRIAGIRWNIARQFLVAGVISMASSAAASQGRVEITWTAHGVPHIVADNFSDLGYGYGYAAATLDVCGLADAFATFSGNRAAIYGGKGQDIVRIVGRRPISNEASDATRRLIATDPRLAAARAGLSPRAKALARGYAAGFNRYVRDTPRDRLPTACRSNGLVRPVSQTDILNRVIGAATLLSSGLMQQEMFDAAPPGTTANLRGSLSAAEGSGVVTAAGSNGYAFGRKRTGGSGLLLGNPHFFWDGPDRFIEIHLTVPGQYDAMGVSLLGMPIVMVGFNQSLAWTHTVSTDVRGAVHRLILDPADSTRYLVDGKSEPMVRRRVQYALRKADGVLVPTSHEFWSTRFGPIVNGPVTPWTRTTAYALADANADNLRLLDQWLEIGRSPTVEVLRATLNRFNGLPWVNTIAADSRGQALYADVSVAPNIDARLAAGCSVPQPFPFARYLMLLDGSRSGCQWTGKRRALLAPGSKPSLLTNDYVENSNASYWLVNPRQPLEGFSPAIGSERSVLNFRTRQGHLQIEGKNPITPAALKTLMLSGTSLQADLVVPALVASCAHTPSVTLKDGMLVDIAEACAVLRNWDRRYDLDSRGAHLFAMFVSKLHPPGEDLAFDPTLWRKPFDPSAPLSTPRDFDAANPRVLVTLGEAVRTLRQASVSLSAPLHEVQFVERGGQRIPLHGGATFSAISAALVPGLGFTSPLNPSNSYLQVVSFDPQGPVADAILASSQTPDPASPFYADQTWLYARKTWVRLPFRRNDVAAAAIAPKTVLTIGRRDR